MTIRGGNILHYGRDFLIDRVQSTGTTLGLTAEKVRELGNNLAVATVRENPDISFNLESYDFTTEVEALLCRLDPTAVVDGQELELVTASRPIDIISPYVDSSLIDVKSVALPYLYLEQADWRFGVRQNSTKRFQLRGDSIYYVPGSTHYQRFGPTASAGPHSFTTGPALEHVEQGVSIYALCVTAFYADGTFERLFVGEGFSNTSAGITLTSAPPAGTYLEVVYGSATLVARPQNIHPSSTVKPAAVRHRDVDVYLSDGAATPTLVRVTGLQSAEVSLRLTSTATEELGNAHTVSRDAEDPDVTGTLTMRPKTAAYMWSVIANIANVATNKVIGALSSTPLKMQIRVNDPDTGATLQTFQIDDARIEPPGPNPQVNQQLEVQFPFSSDAGDLRIFKGTPA